MLRQDFVGGIPSASGRIWGGCVEASCQLRWVSGRLREGYREVSGRLRDEGISFDVSRCGRANAILEGGNDDFGASLRRQVLPCPLAPPLCGCRSNKQTDNVCDLAITRGLNIVLFFEVRIDTSSLHQLDE